MKTPGQFIVSFDCEGRWGMADHLTPGLEASLTTAALTRVYGELLAALGRHEISATFAFVGMFTLTPEELPAYIERLPDSPVEGRSWLDAFRAAAKRRDFDGWLVPAALRQVLADGRHEVGTHGFTHRPLSESVSTSAIFRQELTLVCELARRQRWTPRTIVYPRNQVGHTALLPEFGIVGYRTLLRPELRGWRRQVASLAWELGWAARAQPVLSVPEEPRPISSGFLLNCWHNRSRRLIPRALTVARWRTLLQDAATHGGVVHLWSHPHNFIADPGLLDVFSSVLADAAALVREGRLVNHTQEQYCSSGLAH